MMLYLGAAAAAVGIVLVSLGLLRPVTGQVDDGPVDESAAELDLFRARLGESFSERFVDASGAGAERLVRRLTPSVWHENLRTKIRLAGMEATLEPSLVYVGKLVGTLLGAVLFGGAAAVTGLPAVGVVLMLVFGVVAGFLTPDIVLGRRAEERQSQIRRTLPEALDLMAISVQAGVGLEQAIAVVTERLKGPLGEELARFLNEVQLGFSRREALQNLRERNGCPELSTFILSLLQADALGIAVGEVLKTQAVEIRAKRRQRARERAAKAPVRLLFPLIFGILPALFVVILGPAAIQISRSFNF